MKVLAFASYPVEAAATRYRLQQFVEPFLNRGIVMTVSPFLNSQQFADFYQRRSLLSTSLSLTKSVFARIATGVAARNADVIIVQREAMMFGPPVVEWLAARAFKKPMVLDLDDATIRTNT